MVSVIALTMNNVRYDSMPIIGYQTAQNGV